MKRQLKSILNIAAFALLFSCALGVGHAHANLSLDRVVLSFFPGDRPVQNITVTNQAEKTVKVSSHVVKVIKSGHEDEEQVPTDGLAIAPKVFELPPGESRTVRLVLRGYPEDLEDIYRVRFKPDQAQTQEMKTQRGTSVQIGIVMTMGALVMVKPSVPKPDLTFTREGNKMVFKNNGNITAALQRENGCTEGRKECVELTGKRIYPGMTWETDVPELFHGKPFSQTVLINGQYSTLSYPAP